MSDYDQPDIIFTKTDEAPQLASASLLPIVRKFLSALDISIGTRDISLAGRILAAFPEKLTEAQRRPDDLASLGDVVKHASAKCD